MPVELIPVLASGLLGGLAMLALQLAVRDIKGFEAFDVGVYWSAVLALRGRQASIVGLLVHFLVSIAVAAGYALGFALGGVTDLGWAWGLIGGVIHWVAAGTFVGVVPGEGDTGSSRAPGAFGRALGPNGGIAFLAAHLAFGLVAGFVYLLLHSSGGLSAAV